MPKGVIAAVLIFNYTNAVYPVLLMSDDFIIGIEYGGTSNPCHYQGPVNTDAQLSLWQRLCRHEVLLVDHLHETLLPGSLLCTLMVIGSKPRKLRPIQLIAT